jgi:cytochrome P450
MTLSYDPLLDTSADDPYALYRQFRRERPVYYNQERNLWALFDYEDVMATLPDWKRFSNHWQDNEAKIFLESDAPRHAELRAVIKDPFRPRQVQRFEADFRTRAVALLAE